MTRPVAAALALLVCAAQARKSDHYIRPGDQGEVFLAIWCDDDAGGRIFDANSPYCHDKELGFNDGGEARPLFPDGGPFVMRWCGAPIGYVFVDLRWKHDPCKARFDCKRHRCSDGIMCGNVLHADGTEDCEFPDGGVMTEDWP